MANGYCPYLLDTLSQVAGANDPQTKITPTGFFKSLLQNNPNLQVIPGSLTLNTPAGHRKTVKLKYNPRYIDSVVVDEDNCDIDVIPMWKEMELTTGKFKKVSIYISDEEISKFCEDSSQSVAVGKPATSFMKEHIYGLVRLTNAFVGSMDKALLSSVVWGVNQVSGDNLAQTVNINADVNTNNLDQGFTKILADAAENEVCGDLIIVGSGLFNNFQLQKMVQMAALNGVDLSKFSGYEWYHDLYAKTAWGTNQIGVFSKGSIGFVDIDKYVGFRAGRKGTSDFFQLTLPTGNTCADGTPELFTVNAQLKYHDCPFEAMDSYGQTQTYDRGWQLILTKEFGLFQIPNDAYRADDRLTGNNGSLRYTITNTCSPCEPGA